MHVFIITIDRQRLKLGESIFVLWFMVRCHQKLEQDRYSTDSLTISRNFIYLVLHILCFCDLLKRKVQRTSKHFGDIYVDVLSFPFFSLLELKFQLRLFELEFQLCFLFTLFLCVIILFILLCS